MKSEDEYLSILDAIDELQNIVKHAKARTNIEESRYVCAYLQVARSFACSFHARIAAILRHLAHLVEVATSSSVYILYLGDIGLEGDAEALMPYAGYEYSFLYTQVSDSHSRIPGPDLVGRVGQDIINNCTDQMSMFYGKACCKSQLNLSMLRLTPLKGVTLLAFSAAPCHLSRVRNFHPSFQNFLQRLRLMHSRIIFSFFRCCARFATLTRR